MFLSSRHSAAALLIALFTFACGDNEKAFEPAFEPDYNNLQPAPGVEPATTAQANSALVRPDTLVFPADRTEVLQWQPGRIVVGAPGEDSATGNPLGFARRVISVEQQGAQIIVHTEKTTVQDLIVGDMRVRLDQAAVRSTPPCSTKRPGKSCEARSIRIRPRRGSSTSAKR